MEFPGWVPRSYISPKLCEVLSATKTFLIFIYLNSESSIPSAILYGPNTLVTASNYYSVVLSFGFPSFIIGSWYPLSTDTRLPSLSGSWMSPLPDLRWFLRFGFLVDIGLCWWVLFYLSSRFNMLTLELSSLLFPFFNIS